MHGAPLKSLPLTPEHPVLMQLAGGQATTLEVRLAPV